jgi:hypothetical protein
VDKNIYLSNREQVIFNMVSSVDIAYTDEIRDLFPDLNPHQINKICHSLFSKGYLHRLKKGVYLIQKKPSDQPVIENPYKIALALFKGYIGFSSALRIYDLIDYEPFTIFVLEQLRGLFPEVILKGGTALNRAYLARLGVSRFSEDIDLYFVSDSGLDEKISAIIPYML